MITNAEGSLKIYGGNKSMKGELCLYLLFETLPKKICGIWEGSGILF